MELHRPDGKADLLQQIEHGLISIVGGYRSLGRLYRGINDPSPQQYVLLGDASTQTDEEVFDAPAAPKPVHKIGFESVPDDCLVFTEENPGRELLVSAGLVAASRALKGYGDELSGECRWIEVELWERAKPKSEPQRVRAAAELLLTTGDKQYANFLASNTAEIVKDLDRQGWVVGRTLPLIKERKYRNTITAAVKDYIKIMDQEGLETPYGMPYKSDFWGAGWCIQSVLQHPASG